MMIPVMNPVDKNRIINDTDLTIRRTLNCPLPVPRTAPSISTNLYQRTQTTTQNWTDAPSFSEDVLNNNLTFTAYHASNDSSILIRNPFSFESYEDRFVQSPSEIAPTSSCLPKKNTKISIAALRARFSAQNSQILVSGHGKDRKFIALPARLNLDTILNLLLSGNQSVLRAYDLSYQKTKTRHTSCRPAPDNGIDLSRAHKAMLTDLTLDESAAASPIANIARHFGAISDPRIERTKDHNFFDIIVIAICAVVCGANHWTDVAKFGRAKFGWFNSFLELPKGMDSLHIPPCFHVVRPGRI